MLEKKLLSVKFAALFIASFSTTITLLIFHHFSFFDEQGHARCNGNAREVDVIFRTDDIAHVPAAAEKIRDDSQEVSKRHGKHPKASLVGNNQQMQAVMPIQKRESQLSHITETKTPLKVFPRPKGKFLLALLVTSSATPKGAMRRRAIRETWHSNWHNMTHLLPKWKTFFLLGQSLQRDTNKLLQKESAKYRDMIIGDFTDRFHNLSLKVMMGFEWTYRYCQAKYLIKLDDDVLPYMPHLYSFLLNQRTPRQGLYAGNVLFQSPPVRYGKYAVTYKEYPYLYYPKFVSGGGMVLTLDVARAMVERFNTSNYFKIDDVFVGMLALQIGIDAYPATNFKLGTPADGPCTCLPDAIVQHGYGAPGCLEKAYESTQQYYDVYMKSLYGKDIGPYLSG